MKNIFLIKALKFVHLKSLFSGYGLFIIQLEFLEITFLFILGLGIYTRDIKNIRSYDFLFRGGSILSKRICFTIDTLGRGGAERVMSNLANFFAKLDNKYTVFFICNRHAEKEYELHPKVHQIFLCDEINISQYNCIAKIQQMFFLRKFFKVHNIDVGIAFMGGNNFALILSTLFQSTKSVVSVRNVPQHEYPTILHKFLYTVLFPKANRIVFQTGEEMSYFCKRIRQKGIIIVNPVHDKFYHCNRKPTSNRIVSVGRLVEQKNHKLLIDAFGEITAKYDSITLHIYGDGDLREDLERYIEIKQLQRKVLLHNSVVNIEKHICDAMMFVMTSNHEGMPNALMEAMAMGLPVISTDCAGGGPRELIDSGKNGILVRTKDDLMESMQLLLDDENYRCYLADNARISAESFHENNIFEIWEKLVDNL